MFFSILLGALGLVLLFVGGEALIRGGVSLASRLGLSPLVIGLTVVGFGTSTPELLVSVQAALAGSPDIAIGNVVGSNTSNILLILGLCAVVAPISISFTEVRRDLFVMVLAAILLVVLSFSGVINGFMGMAMLACLLAYLLLAFKTSAQKSDADADMLRRISGWRETLALVGGLLALMIGAKLLVDSATVVARTVGVSEAVIGLTIVAVGTSLPELATSLIAAFRKRSDMAVGNIVGSNIFNILAILGVTSIVSPLRLSSSMIWTDIPFMLAVSIGLAGVIAMLHGIGRIFGGAMLAIYVTYVYVLF